ncbi:MAG TPA: hypothetical protein VGO21_02685 [Candidatus Paceibacterota bacterium]|nr:hypothetical protein [Candidatus Paceibacterota bacterium]
MKFYIADLIQLLIFLISLILFSQKPVPRYLKFFPLYFFLLMIADLALEYTSDHAIHNSILSNTWNILEFSFYFFVLRELIGSLKVKKRILYIILVYAIFTIINLIFVQHNDLFNPINFTIGTIITVVLCIYYFFELFQKTEPQSLSRLPGFWVASAILLNAVLIFPILALISFMDSLSKANLKTSMIVFNHIEAIFNIISILTYILYSIAFICRLRTSKSVS